MGLAPAWYSGFGASSLDGGNRTPRDRKYRRGQFPPSIPPQPDSFSETRFGRPVYPVSSVLPLRGIPGHPHKRGTIPSGNVSGGRNFRLAVPCFQLLCAEVPGKCRCATHSCVCHFLQAALSPNRTYQLPAGSAFRYQSMPSMRGRPARSMVRNGRMCWLDPRPSCLACRDTPGGSAGRRRRAGCSRRSPLPGSSSARLCTPRAPLPRAPS